MNASAVLFVAAFGLAFVLSPGCAPPPPLEDEVEAEVVEDEIPQVTEAERDSIINIRHGFGYERWRNDEYPEAIEHFNTVLLYDTGHKVNIYRMLTDSYINLQMLDSAIYTFEEGIKYFPDDAHLRNGLAIMYRNMGSVDEAIVQQREAVRIKEEAIEQNEDAAKNLPVLIGYLQALKEMQLRINDYDGAIETLERLKELKPDDIAVSNELTNLYRQHRDAEEYLDVLKKEVEDFPKDPVRRFSYAQALADQGRDADAVEQFEIYTRAMPEEAKGWKGLAKCRANLGQYKASIKSRKKVVELEPDNVREMVTVGQDYLALMNWQATRIWARKALGREPNFGPAWLLLGDLYNRAADESSSSTIKYDDKLVYVIAHGMYKKAANSSDPQARSEGNRALQILEGGELVPTVEDSFMNKGKKRPVGKGYAWIDKGWSEVEYIDTFLKNLK